MASLDTNALIDLGNPRSRGYKTALTLVEGAVRRGESICTTRVNLAELRVGIERARDRKKEQFRFDNVIATCVILELNAAATEHFGVIQAHLYSLGRPVGDMDALIAAICIANSQSLITRNGKHFADILGLVVEGY